MVQENGVHHIPSLIATPDTDACPGIYIQRTNVAYTLSLHATPSPHDSPTTNNIGVSNAQMGEMEMPFPINVT